jgi:Holliday junction resolvase-like predicted endonuclease
MKIEEYMKIKETELAKFAISYMKEQGYEIYSEVQLDQYGPVADIVGKMGSVVWVVECKTAAGIAVMEQAYNWIYKANIVSVCTANVFPLFARKWLEYLGIGVMYLTKSFDITEYIHPKLYRNSEKYKKFYQSIFPDKITKT